MTPKHWNHLQQLFHELVDLPSSGREEKLAALTALGTDPQLLDEVRRLLSQAEGDTFFLDTPVVRARDMDRFSNSESLQPGELLGGRFEILRFVGAGGMGEVYEARDQSLGVSVALKCLKREWARDENMTARFRQEVQLSRRVTHRNVCRIFDLGEHQATHGPVFFLTMEFVADGDFSQLIRQRDGIDLGTILDLLRQTIEGVQAAHEAGVVHRDLKPGNVLIDAPEAAPKRAVVTDFGLARILAPENSAVHANLTQTQVQVGTLAYMSPEQLQGEPATVKSDIYSLALLMYEAVTGKRPFADGGALASLVKRSTQTPVPPEELSAALPPLWSKVILHCLNPDPKQRPDSAAQVLQELDGRKALPQLRSWQATRREWLWLATGTAVATAAVVTKAFVDGNWGQRRSMNVAAGTKLLLTQVAYPKEEANLIGMTSLLANQLGQSSQIEIIHPNSVPELLQMTLQKTGEPLEPRKARQLALRMQVPLVLFGAVTRVGSEYVVNLSLEQLNSGSELPQETRRNSFPAANLRDLISAAQEASRWVRQNVGELPASIQALDRRPEEATTDSWEALREYTRGEIELDVMHQENALLAYEAAIRADPGFSMAWMRKGDVYIRLARSAEGFRSWQKAISLLKDRPLTKKEDLRIRAMYASDTWDYAGSVELLKEYAYYYANDPYSYFYRSFPLLMLGRFAEAIEMLRHASLTNFRPNPRTAQLGLAYAAQSDFGSARAAVAELKKLNSPALCHYVSAVVEYSAGNAALCEQELEESAKAGEKDWQSTIIDFKGRLAADTKRDDEAIKLFSDGLLFDERFGFRSNQGAKLLSIAAIHQRASRFSEMKTACLRAMEFDPGPKRALFAGTMLAREQFLPEADGLFSQIDSTLDVPLFRHARNRLRGEILLAKGKSQSALAALRKATNDSPRVLGAEFLAHALERAGFKKEALESYAATLSVRPVSWRIKDPEPAGLWIHSLERAVRLAEECSDPRLPAWSSQWVKARQHN